MSISSAIFNKEIYEIVREDLESFFSTEQQETSILEFKHGDTSLEDVHKEVAAFLNTQGGLLILGSPKEKPKTDNKHIKVCQGDLTPCTKIRSQDTLMRSISSNISPSPMHIRVQSIQVGPDFVFVMEIPQSTIPPHQVNEKGIYYIRLERDAKAAPHGIVEALFNRRQKPDLKVQFRCYQSIGNTERLTVSFDISNGSMITAESLGVVLIIYGAKYVHRFENLEKTEVIDDEIKTQHRDTGAIFVKGLLRQYQIEFTPIYSHSYLEFTYYCKDVQSEQINVLLTPDYKAEIYDSKKNEDSPKLELKNSQEFLAATKEDWSNLLNSTNKIGLKSPMTLEQISQITQLIEPDYNLPSSYRDFLTVTNGYSGMIGSNPITLYDYNSLSSEMKRVDRNNVNNMPDGTKGIIIGTFNIMHIAMLKASDDKSFFGIVQELNYGLVLHIKSHNFFDFMQRASKDDI